MLGEARLKEWLGLRMTYAARGIKAPGVRACERLGYRRGTSCWANSAKLWAAARRHPKYQEWLLELAPKPEPAGAGPAPSAAETTNPLVAAEREARLAEFLAAQAKPLIPVDDLRVSREAARLGVAEAEIRRLPERVPRWDEQPGRLPEWVRGDSKVRPDLAAHYVAIPRRAQFRRMARYLPKTNPALYKA